MNAWPRTLVLAVVLVVAAPAHAADEPVPHSRLFTFDDDEIFESSGLVDRGDTVFTINDSGGEPVVYGVDARTGRTVSRTAYADDATDVEALAPGADGTVWVGDIGDNRRNRDDVSVHQVRPLDGEQTARTYRLAYADGPHDAEALLVHPRTGRVFVVTKSVFGGRVYAAPRTLRTDAVNRLSPFAEVSGLVTDGSFFPDGRRLVLRTYGEAVVHTFPGFRPVGSVRLPSQRQGEGISVSSSGRVLVSSEGVRADVLRVVLPRALTRTEPTEAATAPTPPPVERSEEEQTPREARDWAGIALGAAAVAGLGYLALRGSRVRGPRGRRARRGRGQPPVPLRGARRRARRRR